MAPRVGHDLLFALASNTDPSEGLFQHFRTRKSLRFADHLSIIFPKRHVNCLYQIFTTAIWFAKPLLLAGNHWWMLIIVLSLILFSYDIDSTSTQHTGHN